MSPYLYLLTFQLVEACLGAVGNLLWLVLGVLFFTYAKLSDKEFKKFMAKRLSLEETEHNFRMKLYQEQADKWNGREPWQE